MLSIKDAEEVIKKSISNGKIHKSIDFEDLYIFLMLFDDPEEGIYDPFISVDKETGIVSDYSIYASGNTNAILDKFRNS